MKNLSTGEVWSRAFEKTISVTWAADSKTIFFTEEDHRGEDLFAILEAMAQAARAEGGVYELVPDREEAILKAILEARPGDTVLLAGKGHEATLERGQVALPWNEREAALKALRARGLP